jgi:hypothetical protein
MSTSLIFFSPFNSFNLAFLQKPFINTLYNSKKNKFSLILGNKYRDEALNLNTKLVVPKRNLIVKCQTYLRDAYYSIIGIKLTNLKKFCLFYIGNITSDIQLMTKIKFCLKNSVKILGLVNYNISNNFKLNVENGLRVLNTVGVGVGQKKIIENVGTGNITHSNLISTSSYYNYISLGFRFRSFSFKIPIIISKIENSASIGDIIFFNLMINGIVYSINFFKKLIV